MQLPPASTFQPIVTNGKLEWTPDETQVRSDEPVLQKQMGLRLVSRKGAVELVVIDKAERPSVN